MEKIAFKYSDPKRKTLISYKPTTIKSDIKENVNCTMNSFNT